MWQRIECAAIQIGKNRVNYNLGELAEALIDVLPLSPKSFITLLASLTDARRDIALSNFESLVEYLVSRIGKAALEQHLSDVEDNNVPLKQSGVLVLSGEVCKWCESKQIFLHVYLTRHVVADMSETPASQCRESMTNLQQQNGIFTTYHNFKNYIIGIQTNIVTGDTFVHAQTCAESVIHFKEDNSQNYINCHIN